MSSSNILATVRGNFKSALVLPRVVASVVISSTCVEDRPIVEVDAAAPSSGRFAALFSPLGRRGKRRRWRSPPLGERSDCPELPFAIRLAIRVRGQRQRSQ
ncbi:MAG: hypothetical protein E5Y13_04825 [Mesorhizobium sp.]|nr:MAG: hypothetical protein E5Y13_04825 [Mesorhizobium sp.]